MSAEDIFNKFMTESDIEDSIAVKQAEGTIIRLVISNNDISVEVLEEMLSYAGYEREKQGFINGFRMAYMLIYGKDLKEAMVI